MSGADYADVSITCGSGWVTYVLPTHPLLEVVLTSVTLRGSQF
jgi:hypothetical protein